MPAMTAFLWRAAPPTATPPTRTSAGGGLGLLGPQFGLGCDQVLSLTMVDAQGSLVTASKTQNPRLLAASCGGGGGNFGAWARARGWHLPWRRQRGGVGTLLPLAGCSIVVQLLCTADLAPTRCLLCCLQASWLRWC